MDSKPKYAQSLPGHLQSLAKPIRKRKLTKRERNHLKKKRRAERRGDYYFAPIDKKNSITFHLVHRSTNDPLLEIPDESYSEWVLEPEVNCKSDFDRVQKFFTEFDLEDSIPHHYRSDEFIEKTSAKSMPIMPSQLLRKQHSNSMGAIHENGYVDDYDYKQHYAVINDSNFMTPSINKKASKKAAKTGQKIEILEQYNFDEDYEENDLKQMENDIDYHQNADGQFENDSNFADYFNLLGSDVDENESKNDLQDDFVFHAMGIDEADFQRTQIGDFEPAGARFAKWNEMDRHFEKFGKTNVDSQSGSLYDQTISHLMNIQNAKEQNGQFLDDIEEEIDGQFDDAEESDLDDLWSESNKESIAYNPEMSLLDNQFEIMLNKDYGDEFIGELDDDLADFQSNDFAKDTIQHFSGRNKKKSLRYQYYVYLKNRHRRIRNSLKKATQKKTLEMLRGVDEMNENEESDEIIYMSSEDESGSEVDVMKLDSDDERRINAELDIEFKAKTPPKWDVESVLSTRTNHENHPNEVKVNEFAFGKKKMQNIKEKEDDLMMEVVDENEQSFEVNVNMNDDSKESKGNNFDFGSFSFGNIGANNANVEVIKDDKKKEVIFEFGNFADDDGNKCNDLEMLQNGKVGVHEDDDEKEVTAFSSRKGETKEEKRLRKKLQKEMKQKRKREKKANKLAFKEMKKKNVKLNSTQRKSHGGALRL